MKELLDSVMDLGEQLLINGAEIFRVEECFNRIFSSRGVKRVDSFIINPIMIVSVTDNDDQIYTQTRRVHSITTDMEKLHKLNDLSRRICQTELTAVQIKKELEIISNTPQYPLIIKILANALIAGSFTIFFGGKINEALISLFIGAIMQFAFVFFEKIHTNRLFEKLLSSLAVSLLAFISVKLSLAASVDKIIIGNIMYMIPGVGFTNALRDLFKGDIFAGVHRLVESILISAAIAAGYVLVALLIGGITI